jgi:hypothetical protein
MGLSDILKKVAPIALNYFAPGLSQGLGSSAAGSLLLGAIQGNKPENMLKDLLMKGIGSQTKPKTTTQQSNPIQDLLIKQSGHPKFGGQGVNYALQGSGQQNIQTKTPFEPKTYAGEFAQTLGLEDSMVGKLLNTNLGEGLAAGLLAQLLASGDEEEKSPYGFEQRPFGGGGPGGQVGGITYAAMGGEMEFPRRDGGIDPSEGSGTKDDVPAMLTAGEFVLTKDAVKGLGNGNQRLGIQKAYDMMNNLERMA